MLTLSTDKLIIHFINHILSYLNFNIGIKYASNTFTFIHYYFEIISLKQLDISNLEVIAI
ncbi:hypothetical protein C427_5636 [Paraglaciecola psychrophila 170]|uniref:Uncharacterized protein n=1 Tax=Paraglaciecola psychrophila 170 TaxID=1129794 RepID=K6ZIQ0_9ALTE|nr:hypothetical protein C427_5636 [Paraglaciecola psychrophila 170]GAC35861.1 hypothetical protein GPSY_0219 [Paraglaciecola psychrophila 170]